MTNIIPKGFGLELNDESAKAIRHLKQVEVSKRELKAAHNSLKTAKRNFSERKSVKEYKGNDQKDLLDMINLCRRMEHNLRRRADLSRAKAVMRDKKRHKVRFRKNIIAEAAASMPSCEELNQAINLFGVDIEFLGTSMIEGNRICHKFIIGQHIAKPTADCLTQNQVENMHSPEWLKKIKTCGINRPSMEVHMTARVYNVGMEVKEPMIRIPLSAYNKSQRDFIVDKQGECVDIDKILADDNGIDHYSEYLGGHHPQAVAHLHARVRSGDKHFSACMENFRHELLECINNNDWVYMASLVVMYMTNFDLYDGWVKYSTYHFTDRHISECEPEREVWLPEFVVEPDGQLHFLNKPELFDYKYKIYVQIEDEFHLVAGQFNTENVPTINMESVAAVKVVTDQNQTKLVNMGRRRG